MMKRILCIAFTLLLVAVFGVAPAIPADTQPKVALSLKRIGPGDIVLITVKNVVGPVEGTFNNRKLYFNSAHRSYKALLGVDLLLEPGTYPLEIKSRNKKIQKDITIVKKKYPVQRLTLPEGMVVLSPENEARVAQDQKKTSAIWPIDSQRIWSGSFVDPLPGKKIGTPFGVRRIINNIPKNSHSGMDVTAEAGDPVKAPNDGVVVLVDDQFYSGNSIVLDHGQGIYTMFFHLSKINVRYGQAVMKGDVIGLVGSTGRSTGAHLHWGVRMQGARVDPLALIKLKLEQ